MRTLKRLWTWRPRAALLAGVVLAATGCPELSQDQILYELGFNEGFLEDDWYWEGFYDSWDTDDFEPIYYEGSDIPYLETPAYDAGYWDGVWYAYNDGYFVCYRYAFILGFSEGYDNAFWPDYLDFLAADEHVEYWNGGWVDGYNDGFSEGRVFGAYDYEAGLPFYWEDALLDYESGTDLCFDEVDVCTGDYGPVWLYEYGTDPLARKQMARDRGLVSPGERSIRGRPLAKDVDIDNLELYRPLLENVREGLDVDPATSGRSQRDLRLTTTWLERLESYVGIAKTASGVQHPRFSQP